MWHVLNGYVRAIRSKMTEMADNLSGSFQETDVAMDETIHQALTADYRKTVMEVFRDVIRYLIRRYHVLNSLSEAEYLGRDTVIDGERLPSWAPDYSRPLVADAALGPVSSFFARFCLGYQQYLAPKYDHRLHQRTLDIKVLSLDGFLVNHVGKTTEFIFKEAGKTVMLDEFRHQISGSSALRLKKSIIKKVEVFGITLMASCLSKPAFTLREGTVDVRSEEAIPWANKHKQRLSCLVHAHLRTNPPRLAKTHASSEVQALSVSGDEDRFQKQARKWSRGRKVYKTTKGKSGLSPAEPKAGDEVIVLFGGRTPFVMRPTFDGKGQLLTGETYFYDVDVMAGKVTNQVANTSLICKRKVYDIY